MRSLSFKIGLGYFALICINVLIAIFAIYHINQLGSPIDQILRENYRNVNAPGKMVEALKKQELAQYAMLENGIDSARVVQFATFRNEFLNWHQRAIEAIALPTEPPLLDSIASSHSTYLQQSAQFQSLLKAAIAVNQARQFQQDNIFPLVAEIETFCIELHRVNENAISDADSKARARSDRATWAIIIISTFAIIISILVSINFTQTILRPLKATTETVRRISQGQLNQKVRITTNDEIAELGREFNKMTERLHSYERMNVNKIVQEKRKSEAIVSGIPVAIVVTDESQRLSLMNDVAKDILDLNGAEWEGKQVADIAIDEPLQQALIPANISENGVSPKTLISINNREEEMHLWVRHIHIAEESGAPIGTVTLLQDVTSFKNLDRLKSEFMATISHEFRTPLTSINMAVDILLQEVRGELNDVQRDLLQDAREDCLRLRNLVRDLLDLSRLETENYPMKFETIVAETLIEASLNPLRFALEDKEINLATTIAADLPAFTGDRQQLSRVLINLVENAIQHTPASGRITITVNPQTDFVRFCIADSGKGIPEEAIDLIFDKFVQVKNFADAEKGNIGLGLAIAREIIAAHKGKIWVESKPGQGSRFYFEIPVHPGIG